MQVPLPFPEDSELEPVSTYYRRNNNRTLEYVLNLLFYSGTASVVAYLSAALIVRPLLEENAKLRRDYVSTVLEKARKLNEFLHEKSTAGLESAGSSGSSTPDERKTARMEGTPESKVSFSSKSKKRVDTLEKLQSLLEKVKDMYPSEENGEGSGKYRHFSSLQYGVRELQSYSDIIVPSAILKKKTKNDSNSEMTPIGVSYYGDDSGSITTDIKKEIRGIKGIVITSGF